MDCADPMGTLLRRRRTATRKLWRRNSECSSHRSFGKTWNMLLRAKQRIALTPCTLSDEEIAIFEGFSATLRLLIQNWTTLIIRYPRPRGRLSQSMLSTTSFSQSRKPCSLQGRQGERSLRSSAAPGSAAECKFRGTLSSELTAPFFQEAKVLLPEDVPAICRRHAEAHQAVIDVEQHGVPS